MKPDNDTDEAKRRWFSYSRVIIAPALIIVLYVLSTGPAVWLARRGYVSGPIWPERSVMRLEEYNFASSSSGVAVSVVTTFPYHTNPGAFDDITSSTGTIYKPLRWPYLSAPEFLQRAFDTYLDWWRS